MNKTAVEIGGSLILFILVRELVSSMITGTDTGSTIITNLLSLVVAFSVVMGGLKMFLK